MRYTPDGWRADAGALDWQTLFGGKAPAVPALPSVPSVPSVSLPTPGVDLSAAGVAATGAVMTDVNAAGSAAGADAQGAYNQLAASVNDAKQGAISVAQPAVDKAQAALSSLDAKGRAVWGQAQGALGQAQAYSGALSALADLSTRDDLLQAIGKDKKAQNEIIALTSGALVATGVLAPLGVMMSAGWALTQALQGLGESMGLLPKPGVHCTSQGVTADQVIARYVKSDAQAGSFRMIALSVFADAYANAASCKIPSLMAKPYALLAALAHLWNAAGKGPMVDHYVPHLVPDMPDWQLQTYLAGLPMGTGLAEEGLYSFGTNLFKDAFAFRPLSDVVARAATAPISAGQGDAAELLNEYVGAYIQDHPNQGLPPMPATAVDLLNATEGRHWSRLSLRGARPRYLMATNMRGTRAAATFRAGYSPARSTSSSSSSTVATVAVAGVGGAALLFALKPALAKSLLGPLAKVFA